jgi:NAD(P)-dependent dehydrogenase (short-subunit alcohol dehydrogenase family)
LGQEVAYRLGAEGAHVAVAVRSADQLAETVDRIEASGGSASAFAIDISYTAYQVLRDMPAHEGADQPAAKSPVCRLAS